jgi:hypothetical protein
VRPGPTADRRATAKDRSPADGPAGPDHPVPTVLVLAAPAAPEVTVRWFAAQPPPCMTPEYQQVFGKFVGHGVHDWVRYDPDQPTYEKWQALPLIVLAGLK